jgi:hypothetical protein
LPNPFATTKTARSSFGKKAAEQLLDLTVSEIPNTNLLRLTLNTDPFTTDDDYSDIDETKVAKYFDAEPPHQSVRRNCSCFTCCHGHDLPPRPIRDPAIYAVYRAETRTRYGATL